jgi:hypothetical protein
VDTRPPCDAYRSSNNLKNRLAAPLGLDRVIRRSRTWRRSTRPQRLILAPELLFYRRHVVRATSQLEILECCWPPSRTRHNVMKLEAAGLPASACLSAKRTLSSIALPDLALYSRRNISRSLLAGREARGQSVLPNFVFDSSTTSCVGARSKMTAGSPFAMVCRSKSWTWRSFLVCLPADGELHFEPFRRDGFDFGRPSWRSRRNRRNQRRLIF